VFAIQTSAGQTVSVWNALADDAAGASLQWQLPHGLLNQRPYFTLNLTSAYFYGSLHNYYPLSVSIVGPGQ
jgi:hypothetical protein